MSKKAPITAAERAIKKLRSDMPIWLADASNGDRMHDRPRVRIDEVLLDGAAPDPKTLPAIAIALWSLSVWHGYRGLDAALAGDDNGWVDLERSRRFREWHVRVLAWAYDEDTRSPKHPRVHGSHAVVGLLHALAVGAEADAGWLSERLVRAPTDGVFGPLEPWALMPVALRLAGADAPAARAPWDALLGDIAAGRVRRETLDACADHHLLKARAGGAITELSLLPYDLLPVEFCALAARAPALGVEVEPSDHPLVRLVPRIVPANADVVLTDPALAKVERMVAPIVGG